MENKELQQIFDSKGWVSNGIYWYKSFNTDEISAIVNYIEQLEKELDTTDKALDKACEELSMCNNDDFDILQTPSDWEEWLKQ